VLVKVSSQTTVVTLRLNDSLWPNWSSSGSSERCSRHLTSWNYVTCGSFGAATYSFQAASLRAYKFQIRFPCLSFASCRVPHPGYLNLASVFLMARQSKKTSLKV
jgi:hypothetical protein